MENDEIQMNDAFVEGPNDQTENNAEEINNAPYQNAQVMPAAEQNVDENGNDSQDIEVDETNQSEEAMDVDPQHEEEVNIEEGHYDEEDEDHWDIESEAEAEGNGDAEVEQISLDDLSLENIEDVHKIAALKCTLMVTLCKKWATESADSFQIMVTLVQSHIESIITVEIDSLNHPLFVSGAKVLSILFCANIYNETQWGESSQFVRQQSGSVLYQVAFHLGFSSMIPAKAIIPIGRFIHKSVDNLVNTSPTFGSHSTSIILYPFLLSTKTRSAIFLRIRHQEQMHIAQDENQGIEWANGQAPPTEFKLYVKRNDLLKDTIDTLYGIELQSPNLFRLPLRVQFTGEIDSHDIGRTKEFLNLIVKEFFEEKYRMFYSNDHNAFYRFNSMNFEDLQGYKTLGLILGMAVNIGMTLPLKFSPVVYKKLMGIKVGFDDLKYLDEKLYTSLQSMENDESDNIEEIYCCTFEVSRPGRAGENYSYELKNGGKNIPVTKHNKREYIDLYTDFVLNGSIYDQFTRFKAGFIRAGSGTTLKRWIYPEELEVVLCGLEEIDTQELEATVSYNGFTRESPVIGYFWNVVHKFTREQKKMLLKFITANESVPVSGLSSLPIVIYRQVGDSESLPTSSTCTNYLILPEYSSEEKLQAKLLIAIQYNVGFGVV